MARRSRPTPAARRSWPRTPSGAFSAGFVVGLGLAALAALGARALETTRGAGRTAPSTAAVPSAEAESLLRRGLQAHAEERLGDAFRDYSQAARIAPGDPRPPQGIGQIHLQTGRPELARESLARSLALAPRAVPARILMARALHELGRHEESLAILGALVGEAPNDAEVWWWTGRNCLRLARPEDAARWFRRYTEAFPKNPFGFAYLGKALADSGDAAGAEASYRRAVALGPNVPIPRLWLGQLLLASGRKAEAEPELAAFRTLKELEDETYRAERAVLRRPDDAEQLLRLARLRLRLGETGKAALALERALALRPGDEEARRLLDAARK